MNSALLGPLIGKVHIRFEADVVTARQKTRYLASLLGYDNQDQVRLSTAVSELARNAYQYASGGKVEFFFSLREQTLVVQISDSGPGISDLATVLNGSYISKSGMGIGLRGSKRLMDSFAIESARGQGTKVTIGKSLANRTYKIDQERLAGIIDHMRTKQAETPFEEIQNQNRDLLSALDDLRLSKEQLHDLNQELAETNRGVVSLYAELDEKAKSLQQASETKTKFLSHMSHEFRTPLSAIISLTRLLLQRLDGELSREQERQVKYIQSSSQDLIEMVNDLLDLAKVEAGKVSIKVTEFPLGQLLAELRRMFKPILDTGSPIEFRVEGPAQDLVLKTDHLKLAQILRNLVSNAIKFTEQGSVTVLAALEENGSVHFTVSDTGIGIEAKCVDLIFEDFRQVESNLHLKQKGTGLGLALSKKLARLLGGELWLGTQVGGGSIFHVSIPAFYSRSFPSISAKSDRKSST